MADELTDAAKAEIAAAIAIVREDRFEKFARERLGKLSEPAKPPTEPGTGNPPGGPTNTPPTPPAPPATDPGNENPPGGAPKKSSIWWGDRLDSGD